MSLAARVDVAVEVELHRDRGRAERAGRRHLRDAGNLRELPLQRLRDRRGHGLGLAPGSVAVTWMVGKSTCGSGATGSSGIGDEADEQDARHQQRGGDRVADEGRRDALVHRLPALAVPLLSEFATPSVATAPG